MASKRILGVLFSGVIIFALVGCAGDAPASEPVTQGESVVEGDAPATETETETGTEIETVTEPEVGATETTMPSGARPASDAFPFPVPADWAELDPFMEEKNGGSMAMYGAYEFPGEAKSDAALYEGLLKSAGFVIHPNPLGETVHDASFIVEGNVGGDLYKGGIDFDTIMDGIQRAAINLQKD